MNSAQYKVVKFMTGFPRFDAKQFAELIGATHEMVLRVQATNSFEQYSESDTPTEDLMNGFFGGAKQHGR